MDMVTTNSISDAWLDSIAVGAVSHRELLAEAMEIALEKIERNRDFDIVCPEDGEIAEGYREVIRPGQTPTPARRSTRPNRRWATATRSGATARAASTM